MKIHLHKAFDLLSGCSAVIIDSDFLVYPSMAELEGEYENEFMYLSPSGFNISYKFNEGCNQSVEIENSTMALIDEDGEVVELKLLFPTALSSFCQEGDIV